MAAELPKDLYFCGSIRGGYHDADIYRELIAHMRIYGRVLTEHVGEPAYTRKLEETLDDVQIWKTDMAWLSSATAVIAEVTTPSTGVGYELGVAEMLKKPVLCLVRTSDDVVVGVSTTKTLKTAASVSAETTTTTTATTSMSMMLSTTATSASSSAVVTRPPRRQVSAMVTGNLNFKTRYYATMDEAKAYIDAFLGEVLSESL